MVSYRNMENGIGMELPGKQNWTIQYEMQTIMNIVHIYIYIYIYIYDNRAQNTLKIIHRHTNLQNKWRLKPLSKSGDVEIEPIGQFWLDNNSMPNVSHAVIWLQW